MARNFDECERNIQADLSEIVNVLDFINASFRVSARTAEILPLVAAQPDAREILLGLHQKKLTDLNTLYQSLFLQIWSAFEFFLRTLIIAYIEEFLVRKSDFATLEKVGLIGRNFFHTGTALRESLENRSKLNIDFIQFARNLGTSVPESQRVILNAASFAIFFRQPTSEGVIDALRRIGVKINWDKIGAFAPLQKTFKTHGARETAKQIQEYLDNAARRRNNIVHKGDRIEPINEADLKQAITFFGSFASAVAQFVKDDCVARCA